MVGPIVQRIRVERDAGVHSTAPRLGWVVHTEVENWTQASADIEWRGEIRTVTGAASIGVDWPFEPIEPGLRGAIRVRVYGSDGEAGPWSSPVEVHRDSSDSPWTAPAVFLPQGSDATAEPFLLRTEFSVRARPTRAILRATSFGAHQVWINGFEVDDHVLKPGWTPYEGRVLMESTDVAGLLNAGANAVGIEVAGGWFAEQYGFLGNARRRWTGSPSVSIELELGFADGTTQIVHSGPSWKGTFDGPTTASGIYQGERYDARKNAEGWDRSGFDDSDWSPVVAEPVTVPIEPRTGPPVRVTEVRRAARIWTSNRGSTIIDFGQNLVGRVRLRVQAPRGRVITLRHAEVLDDGELALRPLRYARAEDVFTAAGTGVEEWAPRHTFHGFRYVQVDGWPGEPSESDLVAEVLHSEMVRTGWFDSDHEQLNQLHSNIVWGMRGNFLSVPTDCPQRDERLGWTGDLNVFAPTAAFLYDCNAFLDSWLKDVSLEQAVNGGVPPFVVPDVLHSGRIPVATWGDVIIVAPWVLFTRFGDLDLLRRRFPDMQRYIAAVRSRLDTQHVWSGDFQFGDWLDPAAPPEDPAASKVDADLVATAVLAHSLQIMVDAAAVLGHVDDGREYAALQDQVRTGFRATFVTPRGRLLSDSQTAYAMAIVWRLFDTDTELTQMGSRLIDLVRRDGYVIGTGFVGTPLIAEALSLVGAQESAGLLVTQTDMPSWLYPVTMGATTVWERWDSMLPDGTVNPGEMTSFNHYALGAVADWLHGRLAGLRFDLSRPVPLVIEPGPIAAVHRASARLMTPFGEASVAWTREGGLLHVQTSIPANARAEVLLPGQSSVTVGSGEHRWSVADPLPPISHELSIWTSLAVVADDRAAFRILKDVVALFRTSAPEATEKFTVATKWTSAADVRGALSLFPPAALLEVERRFGELNATRMQMSTKPRVS